MQRWGEVAVEALSQSETGFHICHLPAVAHSGHAYIELWGLLTITGLISSLAIAPPPTPFIVMEMPDFKAGRMLLKSYSPSNSDPNFQLPGSSY